jgi:hypothetical protein
MILPDKIIQSRRYLGLDFIQNSATTIICENVEDASADHDKCDNCRYGKMNAILVL